MRTGSALRRGRARRMPPGTGERSRLPVLLLHDLDPAWSTSDQESAAGAVAELEAALRQTERTAWPFDGMGQTATAE